MLQLYYKPNSDYINNWNTHSYSMISGSNYIKPIIHPMTEIHVGYTRDGNILVACYEVPYNIDADGNKIKNHGVISNEHIQQLCEHCRQWDLSWNLLYVTGKKVSIENSLCGKIPIYVLQTKQYALISWDPQKILHEYNKFSLNHSAFNCFLNTREQLYGDDTVLTELKRIRPGYKAEWQISSGWKFEINYQPKQLFYPKELKLNSDPVSSFKSILDTELLRLLPRKDINIALMFSGGLDSSIILSTLIRHKFNVECFSFIMPEPHGNDQRNKVNYITNMFGVNSNIINVQNYHFYGDFGRAKYNINTPCEPLHRDIHNLIYKQMQDRGCRVIFTGLGGDELMTLYGHELTINERTKIIAPINIPQSLSIKNYSNENIWGYIDNKHYLMNNTISSLQICAPQMIRHGLWPIHLFTNTVINEYCRSLPLMYRKNRFLMSKILENDSISNIIIHSIYNDDCDQFFFQSLKDSQIGRNLFQNSNLSRLEIIDSKILLKYYTDWINDQCADHNIGHLLVVLGYIDSILRFIN